MKTSQKTGKSGLLKEIKSSFESLGDDFVSGAKQSAGSVFGDLNSQLFGSAPLPPTDRMGNMDNPFSRERFGGDFRQEKKEPKRIRRSEVVFNYLERQEQSRLNSEIQQLMREVKREVDLLKVQNAGLVSDISKLALTEVPKNAGIYHLRFMEFVIKLLQTIRKQVSEGRLWLQTGRAKHNARSFRALAKRKGTQFSQSRELTQANLPG